MYCKDIIINYGIFLVFHSGSSPFWLYCGTVLLDKGPHVLRDWWVQDQLLGGKSGCQACKGNPNVTVNVFVQLLHKMFLCSLLAGGITVSIIAFFFTIKFLCELAARIVSFLQNEDPGRRGDRSIYDYVRGNYLDPRSCKVSWDWKEPQEVGQTMTFRVQVKMHFENVSRQ